MSQIKISKIIRSNRRTLALHISADNTLIIKAPLFLPEKEIHKFVDRSKGWIEKRLNYEPKKQIKRGYQEGAEFLYLGQVCKLKIGDYKQIEVRSGFILFPVFLQFRLKKEIESWFIKMAKTKITEMVYFYSKKMDAKVKDLTFSDTSSKWGSCTSDNRLQFCWRLIMAPEIVIRYVVVHELAHTIEHNHSRRFWSKVSLINPSFKQQIKWLKENGDSLVL